MIQVPSLFQKFSICLWSISCAITGTGTYSIATWRLYKSFGWQKQQRKNHKVANPAVISINQYYSVMPQTELKIILEILSAQQEICDVTPSMTTSSSLSSESKPFTLGRRKLSSISQRRSYYCHRSINNDPMHEKWI